MKVLSRDTLKTLALEHGGPHLSLFMPTARRGPATTQGPIRLQNLLREAEARLVQFGQRPPEARQVLTRLEPLLADSFFWQHQTEGLAVFLSTREVVYYRVPLTLAERVVVTDHFYLRPLLPLLDGDGRFYILALSQNQVRLLEGDQHQMAEVALHDMPLSLAEALRYDELHKERQMHTVPGGGGRGAAIYHGQGIRSDAIKDELVRFFREVDMGLQPWLKRHPAPLVLAGVAYLFPLYRHANTYPDLLDMGIEVNVEDLPPAELCDRAWPLVEPLFHQARQAQLAHYRALIGTGQASTDIEEIVAAAYQGRVASLFIAGDEPLWGQIDPLTLAVEMGPTPQAAQDIVDRAAVQTLLNNGAVYTLPSSDKLGEGPLAAVYRY